MPQSPLGLRRGRSGEAKRGGESDSSLLTDADPQWGRRYGLSDTPKPTARRIALGQDARVAFRWYSGNRQ
jgi:hypothetical protein